MNKCAESKALILAVADDDRPLPQRRVARLIGAGHSPSAFMADISKAFKIRTYTEKEKAIARLAALGVGGCEFLKVANRGGILPSYDTAMVDMKFEETLRPGIAPTTTFILKCLPNHPDPLLWDLLVDEISLQPQIGVVKSRHATGTCRTCTSREHRLVDQETVDELANLLEDLSAEALLSVAHHVGITIGDHLLAPGDKQKFKPIKDFWTTLKTVADAAVTHAALPEHLKLLSWDLYLLGSLVDMFVHAIFDVALDVQVALGLLVQAGIGFMAIFIESYGHALNKTWYKHVQRTVQSFLVTGHRLQDMEASSGIPQHMYMVLPGSQRQEGLFRVVRTICTDRNCTDLELAARCNSACMIASVYAKYPELRGTSTASAMDNLRPGNVTGNTPTNNFELRTIIEKAVRNSEIC